MRIFITEDGRKYHSFLKCIEKSEFTIQDLNENAILEFFKYGELYFDETFIKGVKKTFTHQPLKIQVNEGFTESDTHQKNPLVESNIENPVDDFLSFFERRVEYLKSKKISVHLTGGIDSRLVAVILNYFEIPFDAAFSLDSGSDQEAEIAKSVADQLGINLHFLTSNEINSEHNFGELFELGDGCWDLLKLKSLNNTLRWRKEHKYELVISGVGGELYKDFFWLQDFPFYNKKQADLHSLVKMRMYPLSIKNEFFGPRLKKDFLKFDQRFFKRLSEYQDSTNTKTYDQIYYHIRIKEQLSIFSHATQSFIDSYSPLIETELLKIGYNLPRKKRFFNRFHREIIGSINPEIGKIRTTEGGMTVSNKSQDLIKDIFKYGFDKSTKLLNKIIGKAKNQQLVSNLNYNEVIENANEESLSVLKNAGIINMNVEPKEIADILKGRIITLGYVIKQLN